METKMARSENVSSYLTWILQVCDELAAIGHNVEESYLMSTTLKVFLDSWKPFIKGVVAWENLPYWNKLLDVFIEEELWDEGLQHKSYNGKYVE